MAYWDKPLPSTPDEDDDSSDWQSYISSEVTESIPIPDTGSHSTNKGISFATRWRSKFGTSNHHSVILSNPAADRQGHYAPAAQAHTPRSPLKSLSYPHHAFSSKSIPNSASVRSLHPTVIQHLDTASLYTAPASPFDSVLYHADVHGPDQPTDKLPGIFLCPPPTVTGQLAYTVASYPHNQPGEHTIMNPMASPNVPDLLTALSSKEDPARKLAVFKLQSLINDPSFAELFVTQGGLPELRDLILVASGNTLAYSLASFARLLEVDQGWDGVDKRLIQKSVELVVSEPLVNILRGALSVLVAIVSRLGNQSFHAQDDTANKLKQKEKGKEYIGGFKALKPAIAHHPQFLEMLVSRLSSADHSLCANALQLINALMRDAITKDDEHEWPKFIKRIQDLGVIKAVYILMQSSALQDLAAPLLDFQALTKVLLRRWRDVPVDLSKPEHRRTIKALHLSSNPERSFDFGRGLINQPKHNPYKWRRLGFTTESPEPDFEYMGFLGMMDLSDYVRKHQDEFQHILLEQVETEAEQRCPIARASLFITVVLFEHFEVDKTELEDTKNHLALESRTNFEAVFKPLLLHWSRLHVAGLHAFLRLWKATGAELQDFNKIEELIRILIESVVGGAERTKGIDQIEQEMAGFEIAKLRELQMELLELTYEDIWGQHLRSIREELRAESLQFVKEQRIQCLLRGSWFPDDSEEPEREQGGPITDGGQTASPTWTYIKLSPDRKYLHFGNFRELSREPPSLGTLHDRIDLSIVSSVVSNVTASEEPNENHTSAEGGQQERYTTTKISIHGYARDTRSRTSNSRNSHRHTQSRASKREHQSQKEIILLTFQPENHRVASEWLDGMLMLLEQQPITAETNKLISVISDHGLKVRLLNVRFNDEEGLVEGMEAPPVPSRDGLDEDYYYEI